MQDIIELYAEKKAKEAAKRAAQKAEKKTAREYVCKLLKGGLPVEKVAALLDMTKAQVEALAEGSHTA